MSFTFLRITERYVLRVLALGFLLVMVLLGTAGLVAVRQSQGIRRGVQQMTRDEFLIARLRQDVQSEENTMTGVLHQFSQFELKRADVVRLLQELDESDRQISRLGAEARALAGAELWADLESSVKAFTQEQPNSAALSVEQGVTFFVCQGGA